MLKTFDNAGRVPVTKAPHKGRGSTTLLIRAIGAKRMIPIHTLTVPSLMAHVINLKSIILLSG